MNYLVAKTFGSVAAAFVLTAAANPQTAKKASTWRCENPKEMAESGCEANKCSTSNPKKNISAKNKKECIAKGGEWKKVTLNAEDKT